MKTSFFSACARVQRARERAFVPLHAGGARVPDGHAHERAHEQTGCDTHALVYRSTRRASMPPNDRDEVDEERSCDRCGGASWFRVGEHALLRAPRPG